MRRTAGSQGQQGCPRWSTEERGCMPPVPHLCLFPLRSSSFPRGGDALLLPAAAMRGPAAASGLVGTSQRRAGMSREDTAWGVLCWVAPRESCKTLRRVLETQRRKQRLKKKKNILWSTAQLGLFPISLQDSAQGPHPAKSPSPGLRTPLPPHDFHCCSLPPPPVPSWPCLCSCDEAMGL